MAEGASHNETRKTRVFLSYSRTDRAFAEALRDRLLKDGFDAYLDVQDIVKGEPWQERLQNLIFGADAVLFLVSPDSVASDICEWEVKEAERLAKRILPVMCRATRDESVPGRLKRLNYVFLDAEPKWAHEYPKLCEALVRDIAWLREHTRYSELAARWDRDSRPDAQLLRLEAVRDARKWEARRPPDAVLGGVLAAFLDASEQKESKDQDHLLAMVGRAYVQPAAQAVAEGRIDSALRIAAAGVVLSQDVDLKRVPELGGHIAAALRRQTLFATLEDQLQLPLACAAFSPDGARVVAAMRVPEEEDLRDWDPPPSEEDRRSFHAVRIFDMAGRSPPVTLLGQDDQVERVAFRSDGRQVAAESSEGRVLIWDAASGAMLKSSNAFPEGFGRDWRRSPDGARVLELPDHGANAVHICDAASGRRILALTHAEEEIQDAHFSPDGTRVLTICDTGTRCWDASSGAELPSPIRRDENAGGCCAFTADGSRVLDEDGRIWNAETDPCIATFEHDAEVAYATPSPDGTRLATACGETVRIWDTARATLLASFQSPAPVRSVSFSPDGRRVLAACRDGAARLFDLAGGREPLVLSNVHHPNQQRALAQQVGPDRLRTIFKAHAAFNADGARIVTVDGMTACIWDAATGQRIKVLNPAPSVAEENRPEWACFSPDGTRIVVASNAVDDSRSGLRADKERADQYWASKPLFDQDGRPLVVPPDHRRYTARIWDVASAREIMILRGLSGEVRTGAFSPDGAHVVTASGGWAGVAQVFDVATGRRRASMPDASSAFFDLGGGRVVVAGKTLRVCDAGNGDALIELAAPSGAERFASAEFSADGMRVVAAAGRTVCLYDVTRTMALAGDVVEVLAASLSNGRGRRGIAETDRLMQEAPGDLYEALMALLTPERRDRVALRAAALARPLHPNCYLAPSRRPGAVQANAAPAPAARPTAPQAAPQSAPQSPPKPASRAPARARKRGGGALWFVLAILVLGAATVFALDYAGVIALGLPP
jgi:WD40 repeat protein